MNGLNLTLVAVAAALITAPRARAQNAKSDTASATNMVRIAASATSTPTNTVQAPSTTSQVSNPTTSVPAAAVAPANAGASAVPNPETKAPERNIRFQFDGLSYADVLERFAQMANKPLLTDTNLPGTLTFNDPQPYNYQEALDTLNLILSMKGMTLMEDGHYLRLVPFKQLPQMPLRILRGLETAGDVRPGEIVTVVLQVKNLDTKEVADAVLSMISNAGSIAPLTRGRGLIVTDRLSNIQRIRTLLAAIDNESVAERQMKAFTLLHASGAVVADLINRTFGIATAPKRTQFNPQSKQLDVLPADPDDYVTAVYDDGSRTLVLFGPRERLGLAEELIAKFEDKGGPGGEVRIYYPVITKAEELAQMIREAIPGVAAPKESAATAATKARVIADTAQNRLIVAAPVAGLLDQIELLVNKLDKPVHGTGGTYPSTRSQTVQVTKVFRTRSAEASSVAKILTDALTRATPTGLKLSTANVTVEPNSQSVVVTGSPGDVQTAVDIVTQLETGSTTPLPQQTRFIDAGTVSEAKRLLPLVEQIYRSQVTDSLGGQVAHAKIIADSESGRLIVTASEDHVKRIEEIVKQLKAQSAKLQPRNLQIIGLKHLRIDTALASLTNLVNERLSDRRFEGVPKPLLLPDAANNRLLVTADDEQFRQIQEVVNTLDIAPEKIKREMMVIPVQSKSASELITLTSQLMTQLGEDQTNPQLAPKLLPDTTGKQIIVLATAKDLERITNLVHQLDSASAAATARQSKGVELFGRTAAELTPLVQQLYQEQVKGQPEPNGGPAALLSDAKNNRIMVSGSEKEIARVEAIVRQLDPEGKKGAKEETRVIRLRSALASDLGALIEKSLNARSQQIKILVDTRSNSLVVSGDSGAVASASQIVEQLDTRSDIQPRELRIVELKQGDAATVAPMATTLSTEILKDQRGPEYVPQTKILPDAAGNRLILTGPKDELNAVSSVIERLNQPSEAGGAGSRVFKLNTADAISVAQVVSNAMLRFEPGRTQPTHRATVSADKESNSVIVSGPRAELQDAQSIIEKLDGEGVEKGRHLKLIEVRTDDPTALATLTLRIFSAQNYGRSVTNLVSVTPEPSGKRLIVLAPPTLMPQIETVISTLDAPPGQGPRELQTVELKNAGAQELMPTVTRIYGEQTKGNPAKPAAIYADNSGARLMVYGTKEQAAAIRQIVETFEKQERAPRETRTFDVGNPNDAQRLLPLVQQLYKDQWKDKAERDPADAQIVSDPRTGRLIVTGKPEHIKQIEAILTQLRSGGPKADARDTRVYELTTGIATELAGTVRTLYQEEAKSRLGSIPADALILADTTINRLIVSADTNELQAIEAIIQKLEKVEAQAGRTRVFKLKTAEAEQVATLLSTALVQITPTGRNIPRVTVGADKQNNLLIVSGEPKDLQSASVIVEQMDAVLAKEPRQMRIIPLKSGVATQMSTSVRTLYQDQIKGQPRMGTADALVLGDDVSNRLIITAGESHMKVIEEIVNQLQQAGGSAVRQLRVIMLARNSAASIATMVSQLFSRQTASQDPGERVVITPSGDDRTLVLEAPTPTLEKIEQLVKMLDGEEALGTVEVRTYRVPEGNAVDLAQTLTRLFTERRTQPAVGLAARFEADANANILMVAATRNQFVQIDKLIEEVRKTAQVASEIRTFRLRNSEAAQIAEVLQSMLLDTEPLQPGQTRPQRTQFRPGIGVQAMADTKGVRVAPAPSLNAVIVQGPPEKLMLAEKLIQTLDKEESEGQSVIQTVHLKNAHAENLADAVTKNVATRGPESRLQRVTVTPVIGPNSLLLNGPADAVQDVLKIIRELDEVTEDDAIKVHIYKLQNGNAKEISAVIQQLLQTMTRGTQRRGTTDNSPRAAQPSVAVDARSNSLVVSGAPAHFKMVEQLLKTLDAAPDRAERDVQFVWLHNAKALDVTTKLEEVFAGKPLAERPVIDSDSFNNSITIIGKHTDIVQIQDLIARLDISSQDSTLQVRLRPLDRIPAEQMARVLQNIYPQMSAGNIRVVEKLPMRPKQEKSPTAQPPGGKQSSPPSPEQSKPTTENKAQPEASPDVVIAIDKNANALILSGPTHELDQIDRILSDLSFSYVTSDAEFRIFALKEADPVMVARTLTELFKPEPVPAQGQPQPQARPGEVHLITPAPKIAVVAEPRTRSVIVRAKPTDFSLLETLVKQLDVAGVSSQLEYRIVALTNSPPEKIIPLVQQMVTQLNVLRPGEPLTVTADPRSHGLFVVARETALKQIETMIHSLDTPPVNVEVRVLVLPLKKANAGQLSTVLQNMLKPGAAGELTPQARELQEQVQRLTIQNDEGKTVLLDLTKPIKIMADPSAGGQGGANRLILSSTADNLKALAAVVEMMDAVPVIEGVNIRLVHLQFADAATVSQTLSTIFQQGQRLATGPSGRAEPEGNNGKALVNPLNVAVDERSNTLIVSGHQESLDLAQKIINDLDRKVERFITEVRLFRLKHASAIRLAPLLQAVFAEGPTVPGAEGLTTQVTRLRAVLPQETPQTTDQPKARAALLVQADDTSNIIIVAARSDTMPVIEKVINQLDIPSASGLDSIRVYTLNHADAVMLQKIIGDIFTGPRATQLRTEDKPNVTIDERTQALIVAGNGKAFAIIDSLIAQLDKPLTLDLRDVRILPLEHADAAEVATALQRLLDARLTQRGTGGKQQADAMKVVVIGEPRSNSLLIAGSKDSFELIQSLTKELDRAPTALSGRIRLVPLAYADARFLSTALNNLFTQRSQGARTPDVQRKRPVIVPDPRSNSLLVAAGVDENQIIDDLVQKLDRKLDSPALSVTVLPLQHNDAARVAANLEAIFAARSKARTPAGQQASPQDDVQIETDSLNNALIVSANRENLDLLKSLLEKIDIEPVATGGLVQTFTLEFADAQRVAGMLRSLVQQGLYRPGVSAGAGKTGTSREALAITVDSRSNTLIISASPENLLVVKEVIKQIDTKDFAAIGNVRLYPLKHAKASSLATVLEQFFRARRTGDGTGGNASERSIPLTVVPDDRVNTLLITGGKESFDVIERVIQQLDAEDTMARMTFKVFPLKQSTASKLQNTLQRLFVNRPARIKGETPEPITVVADAWANALIVGASVDDMGMVSSLIERLDSEQTQLGVTVQVIPLAKADARRVAQTVQGLYREGAPGAGAALPVVVTADERLNAIVVSAGETDIKRITELIKKLDTDQVARVAEIRIFPLKFAKADSLSTILNTALNAKPTSATEPSPNSASLLQFITRTENGNELVTSALKEAVLITPDTRMNSLIVSAPVDHMGLLEQIVNRLDSSSPQQAKIKVFTLVNADARQMAEVLMSLFRLQPQGATPATATQRAIQYTLVKPITTSEEEHDTSKPPSETAVASAVIGSDEQSALHVTIDPRTNTLLVGGTEHYVGLVSEVIESLDSSSTQERKSEVYRLKNAQATEVQSAIRSFLDQERQRVAQVLGQEAVGTAQRLLEHEVAIVAEPVSNTLLLSANPRYFDQIKDLIKQIDQPQPQVLIQVLLAEVTLDSTRDLGIEWNITRTVEAAKIATGTDFGVLNELQNFGGFSTAVTGSNYNFLLRALENEGRLEVLSRPQILTSDNKPASINVGQRVPLVTDSRLTQFGDTINSFRYEDVGVGLTVTPRIGSDGSVKMEISTTNSALSSSSIEVSNSSKGTVRAPIINQRRASTFVNVQSGQSIIIGGLISTSEDNRTKKVPFLGDVPYLGALFRSKTRIADRKELLILLTPQVLLNTGEIAKTSDTRTMTEEQLERSSIKDQIKRDGFRDRLLEPLYPEKLKQIPEPKPGAKPGPAEPKKKPDTL